MDNECAICLDQKVEVVLPCGHGFCNDCIVDWVSRDRECPMCREDLNLRLEELQKHMSHEMDKEEKDQRVADSFFDLIDVQGKDNVDQELQKRA